MTERTKSLQVKVTNVYMYDNRIDVYFESEDEYYGLKGWLTVKYVNFDNVLILNVNAPLSYADKKYLKKQIWRKAFETFR